jgi:uncharacterized protein
MSATNDSLDRDLQTLSREQLIEEVAKLRRGVRVHRDSTGHELCWHHPALWGLLPERTDPLPVVPSWPQFLAGCLHYRQSLDQQAGAAPRTNEPYRAHLGGERADSGSLDSETEEGSILWRRADGPGHDACRLVRGLDGWRVEGAAAFRDDDGLACLTYAVECDVQWRTRRGWVRGHWGARRIEFDVSHTGGVWRLNRLPVDDLTGCVDLDLGFTPATNVIAIRRSALAVGQTAEVRSAWLDVVAGSLRPLEQRYQRRSAATYWYESPEFGYAAELDVADSGFIRRYPRLWDEEVGAIVQR